MAKSGGTVKKFYRGFLGATGCTMLLCSAVCSAQSSHQHEHGTAKKWGANGPVFQASTDKKFGELMSDAMAVMDYGMQKAPMNGNDEHDFASMMIPHHQGAIDMAKALLLTTKDPELRNLAQGMITEQQIEIQLMQAWLRRSAAKGKK